MPLIYEKPPLSIDEQITLLRSRGLIIDDPDLAKHYLNYISYYRLSGYTITFEKFYNGKRSHIFKEGTSFENIIELYNFDRLLRNLVMDAIERIEVAIRTQICLILATTYNDSHWQLNFDLFKNIDIHKLFLKKCIEEQRRSREIFANHYKHKYDEPEMLPAWMLSELLPLGAWSRLFDNIDQRQDRKKIADKFNLPQTELASWLHSLTYIRNLCAHHSRLWNRHFTITPKAPKQNREHFIPNNTFAAQAAMMYTLLKVISPDSDWSDKLKKLILDHSFIDCRKLGFDSSWHESAFWQKLQ